VEAWIVTTVTPFTYVVLLLFLAAGCGRVAQDATGYIRGHRSFSSASGDGSRIQIELETVSAHASPYRNAEPWGAAEDTSAWIVAALVITLNDKALYVPMSAYSSLANVQALETRTTEQAFEIVLTGGAEHFSYTAVLTFDNAGVLKKQRTFSGEFPDELWEETAYSFIPDDGR
jgi:hypothetical protein